MDAVLSSIWRAVTLPWRLYLLLRKEKRGLSAGIDAVVSELEFNADVIARLGDVGGSGQRVQNIVEMNAWERHRTTIHVVQTKSKALWTDLDSTYKALKWTKAKATDPPSAGDLRDVAERLRNSGF